MAGFGGGDDVQIKVTLDTATAEREAQALQGKIQQTFTKTGAGAGAAATSIGQLTQSIQNSAKANSSAAVQAVTAATGLNSLKTAAVGTAAAITTVTTSAKLAAATVAGLTAAVVGIFKIAGDGDKFQDIADAFEANAKAAGLLANELRGNLRDAVNGTVSDLNLLKFGNKAFQFGIDPKDFDDIAAAAKRAADQFGGDTVESLDQLVQALNSGRTALLKKFGTVKDGVLIIKEFNSTEAESAKQQSNVTDIYEQFTAAVVNAYNEIGSAINNSEALKLTLRAVGSALSFVGGILKDSIIGFINITNALLEKLQENIQYASSSFAVLGEILGQLKSGEVPSLSKAIDNVARGMLKVSKEGKKTGDILLNFKKDAKGAAEEAKKLDKALSDIISASDSQFADALNLEQFVLPGDEQIPLRDAINKAIRNVDPTEVYRQLQAVRTAFLQGITGTPEEIQQETQKRVGILFGEYQKVLSENDAALKAGEAKRQAGLDEAAKNDAGLFSKSFRDYLADELGASEGAIDNLEIGAIFGEQIISGLGSVLADGKVNRDDTAAIGATIGGAIGLAICAYFGGPAGAAAGAAIGSSAGGFIAQITEGLFGKDSAGTAARKEADRFFADIFDANRLSAIINGQIQRISDLTFAQGEGGGIGDIGRGLDPGMVTTGDVFSPNPSFDGETFDDNFQAQTDSVRAGFAAVGAAFEELLGVSEDISGQIGAILVNNIGGSLQNLQILVQATGQTFEVLSEQIFNAFLDGTLSIEEAYQGLVNLQELFEIGIPGAVGAVDEAIQNFQIALADGKGSRQLIDSIRDIGAEGLEVGRTFQDVAGQIGSALGFTTGQMAQFFNALRASGINSLQDLANASNAVLLGIAENARRIQAGIGDLAAAPQAPGTTAPQGLFEQVQPVSTGGGGGGGGGGAGAGGGGSSGPSEEEKKAEEKKRNLQQLAKETYRLFEASAKYDDILDRINNGEVTRVDATKEIKRLYKDIFRTTKELDAAEKKYQDLLDKGVKKNSGRLAALGTKIDELKKKQDGLTETSREAARSFVPDLSKITPFIRSANDLAVVLASVGVNAEQSISVLVKGFLQGRLSIAEVNAEIEKTQDLLGAGIPKVVGAADQAFKNLIEGGRQGGSFSVDAFKDVFAEFDELFKEKSGPERRQRFADLTADFNAARDALNTARDNGASVSTLAELQDAFDGAKKALTDFNATTPKAGFGDLRQYLEGIFDPGQVGIFFQALNDSGINTFEGFQKATDSEVTKILGTLDRLGFAFGDTSQRVKDINAGLQDQENTASGGDILGGYLQTITGINQGAEKLPGFFNSTNESLLALNNTLPVLDENFNAILNRFIALDGQRYQAEVVFNVTTSTSGTAQTILDILDLEPDAPTEGPGLSPEQIAKKRKRLRTLVKAGKGKSDRAKKLREELEPYR